jgi:hypothetical protein
MNQFTRIALAAGLLATPALPALAQNGTPLTGITSPTASTQPPAATATPAHQNAAARHVSTVMRKPAAKTPVAKTPIAKTGATQPAAPAQPAPTKTP